MEELLLISNPGGASRKYAVFAGKRKLLSLHFEREAERIVCTAITETLSKKETLELHELKDVVHTLPNAIKRFLPEVGDIKKIATRIVAPSGFFLSDHVLDDEIIDRLESLRAHAPLHIDLSLDEIHAIRHHFPNVPLIGISDSAFHASKPDHAWLYGLPLHDMDRFEIKRYGYHGLAAESALSQLATRGMIPSRIILCHLGNDTSVTAIQNGRSIDTTMGYSPLEGPIMATGAGSLDWMAAHTLQQKLGLDSDAFEAYLSRHSGLLGISEASSDIRELLALENNEHHYSHLALEVFVASIQKAIGQMVASIGGIDALVFTGATGERSAEIRTRIAKNLAYLGILIDPVKNVASSPLDSTKELHTDKRSKPIYAIKIDETTVMAKHAKSVSL